MPYSHDPELRRVTQSMCAGQTPLPVTLVYVPTSGSSQHLPPLPLGQPWGRTPSDLHCVISAMGTAHPGLEDRPRAWLADQLSAWRSISELVLVPTLSEPSYLSGSELQVWGCDPCPCSARWRTQCTRSPGFPFKALDHSPMYPPSTFFSLGPNYPSAEWCSKT